jgi:hypothetical protein
MLRELIEAKRRARELAIFAIPMMVCCFTWYMIPAKVLAVAFFYCGALMLALAGVTWWRPSADGPVLRWVFVALAFAGFAAIQFGWAPINAG